SAPCRPRPPVVIEDPTRSRRCVSLEEIDIAIAGEQTETALTEAEAVRGGEDIAGNPVFPEPRVAGEGEKQPVRRQFSRHAGKPCRLVLEIPLMRRADAEVPVEALAGNAVGVDRPRVWEFGERPWLEKECRRLQHAQTGVPQRVGPGAVSLRRKSLRAQVCLL